ncbi:MAG: flagellar export protein FliJ [Halanaerobiales bacterium]|nr:flagellar export protein FliJ [Halanaerobiales bacterium]
MAKYNFRLQRVLDIREVELDKAQNELYQARQKEKDIEDRLNEAKQQLSNLFNYIRNNDLDVMENIRTRDYIKKQQKKIQDIYQKLQKHREVVNAYKDNVIEKKQSKEKIVKIKEKKSKAFYKEFLKKQQKELDEISLRLSNQGV